MPLISIPLRGGVEAGTAPFARFPLQVGRSAPTIIRSSGRCHRTTDSTRVAETPDRRPLGPEQAIKGLRGFR